MTEKKCIFCDLIKEGRANPIYEDDKIIAMLDINPASAGHILVMPKEHYPIIEQIPDPLIGKLFTISNKLSTAVFESLNSLGTNIMINNGISAGQKAAHSMIHIIPRRENDGIDFAWQPKQLNEEEMSTIELQLKEQTKNIGEFEQEAKDPVNMDNKAKEIESDPENYQLKQMDRIP